MTRRVVSLLCVSLLVFAVSSVVTAQDAATAVESAPVTATAMPAPCSDCQPMPEACGAIEVCGPICAPVACYPVCRPICRPVVCCDPCSCYGPCCCDPCGPRVIGYRRGFFGACRPVYAAPRFARVSRCCW